MKRFLTSIFLVTLLVFFGCGDLTKRVNSTIDPAPYTTVVEISSSNCTIQGDTATILVSYINRFDFYRTMSALESKSIKKIHLVVSSGGGSLHDMSSILDMLNRFKLNGGSVTSHAMGVIGSAAIPIYLQGDYRTMGYHVEGMLHPHSLWGKKLSMYTYKEEDDLDSVPTAKTLFKDSVMRWTRRYAQMLVDKTNLTFDEAWKYLTTGDETTGMWYFSAKQMLVMGFAHKLI